MHVSKGYKLQLIWVIGRLIVETDAKMVVQALSTDDYDAVAVGVLIAEIKSLVPSSFISFECSFKSRFIIEPLISWLRWAICVVKERDKLLVPFLNLFM